MNHYRVVFRREALEDLEELYDFIADAGSPQNASSFTDSIVSFCESFADFPQRGTARDDLRPGLRTVGYLKRVVIAFAIINEMVAIVRIFNAAATTSECSAQTQDSVGASASGSAAESSRLTLSHDDHYRGVG